MVSVRVLDKFTGKMGPRARQCNCCTMKWLHPIDYTQKGTDPAPVDFISSFLGHMPSDWVAAEDTNCVFGPDPKGRYYVCPKCQAKLLEEGITLVSKDD